MQVTDIASSSHGFLDFHHFRTFSDPSSHENHGIQGNLIFVYSHLIYESVNGAWATGENLHGMDDLINNLS